MSSASTTVTDAAETAAGRRDLEAKVLDARIILVFERSRLSNLMAVPVGLLLVWMLWGKTAPGLLAAWLIAKLAVCAWRAWIDHRQARALPQDRVLWFRWMQFALLADGAVYGLVGTLLLPEGSLQTAAMLLAMVVGIAAVGFLVLSADALSAALFVAPLVLPSVVVQLQRGDETSLFAALALVFFLALVAFEVRRAARHTLEMLRLRFQMSEMADQREQALSLAVRHSAVKSQFLANMSHEMRTPLHAILGLARLLATSRRLPAGSDDARHLDMLVGAGQHLLALINDVLDVARIENAHLELDNADFDLAALIREVAEVSRLSTTDKGLRFTAELLLPQPCRVRGDAARLRQILVNLTGNAVKFTDQGGVTLRARRLPEGPVCIEVIDTGVGIAATELPRIFDAFHQADGSFGRRFGGTGLGLAIARELARAMGGNLVCESTLGRGSRFTLTLPLLHASNEASPARLDEDFADMPPAAPPADAAEVHDDLHDDLHDEPLQPDLPVPRLRGTRVLVVDDNPVNAIVAEAMLQRAGAQVEIVGDGGLAIERAERGELDLVLMDCQMPGIDGLEATRRIRAHEAAMGRARLPVVALTANAFEGDRDRSLAAGMDDHLVKPISEAALVETVAHHVAHHARHAA